MNMHNPLHPGKSIKKDYLEPLNLTTRELANGLGVAKSTVDRLVKGQTGVTTDMAIRLGICLSTTPESWLGMQRAYDVWKAQKENIKLYKSVKVIWKG